MTDIYASITQFLKFQFAASMIFWTCVWSVKASFLAFFKRLTTNVKGHYAAWWVILVITVLAYIGCVITYPVSCSDFSPSKLAFLSQEPSLMRSSWLHETEQCTIVSGVSPLQHMRGRHYRSHDHGTTHVAGMASETTLEA